MLVRFKHVSLFICLNALATEGGGHADTCRSGSPGGSSGTSFLQTNARRGRTDGLLSSAAACNAACLILIPRPDGFNNQLLTVYEQLAAALHINATVILPHFVLSKDTVVPWEFFFNTDHVKAGMRIASLTDVSHLCPQGVERPSALSPATNDWRRSLLLEEYSRKFRLRWTAPVKKKSLAGRCMTALPEVDMGTAYSNYSNGQGYALGAHSWNANFTTAWGLVAPSAAMLGMRDAILDKMPPRFNAVHIRRGDYQWHCQNHPEWAEQFGNSSCWVSKDLVLRRVQEFSEPDLPLFVATNDPEWARTTLLFTNLVDLPAVLSNVGLDYQLPERLAVLEQLVAAYAVGFVGNRFSSFTSTIANLRWKYDKKTTRYW